MKKIMFILLCGVIPFLLSSCSDDDDNNGGGSSEVVKQIIKYDESSMDDGITTFNYDSKNRLSNYVITKGNYSDTEVFKYDNNGKLIKLSFNQSAGGDEEDYIAFSYNGNTVIATEHYKYENQVEETYTYTYTLNNKGLVTKKLRESGYYYLYTYDSNNNLNKSQYYDENDELIRTTTWEYDNKNSLLSDLGLPAWFFVAYNNDFSQYAGKNNAVKKTNKYSDDEVEEYLYSYTYDTDGYPTSYTKDGKTVNIEYRTVNK